MVYCITFPVSPITQLQLQEEEQGQSVEEQQLTTEEVVREMRERVMLVDAVTEVYALEERLREVRDLEERLQEMDERAERIQDVVEEELGKEVVERLREEERDLEQKLLVQGKGVTKKAVRKSVRRIDREGGEADELEEEIKEVFLKDLLSDEERVAVRQEGEGEESDLDQKLLIQAKSITKMVVRKSVSRRSTEEGEVDELEEQIEQREGEKEVTDESLLDDRFREKLRQMEQEWQEEVDDATAAGGYKKVEVLEKREIRRKTEVTEERSQREVTERSEGQSQVEDGDVWFKLLDRPPYRPPGTVC